MSPTPPAFERIDALKMPFLIIIDSEDSAGAKILNTRVHKLLPHSELVTIMEADHVPSLSKPNEFNKILLNFLRRINT